MSPAPVGSLAEEAAKLIAAVQGMAAGASSAGVIPDDAEGREAHAGHAGHAAHTVGQSAECRYCPICQLVRLAKATSPEVREHLTSAALSLTLAVKGLLDGSTPDPAERAAPVEKIDLAED